MEEEFQLQYKLQGKGVDEDPKGLFHINEDTGSIYVHQKIDYEQTSLFQVSHLLLLGDEKNIIIVFLFLSLDFVVEGFTLRPHAQRAFVRLS